MRRLIASFVLLSALAPMTIAAAPAGKAAASPINAAPPRFTSTALDDTLPDNAHVYSQNDPSTLVTGLDLFLLAGLDRQERLQGGTAALTAQMLLDNPVDDQGVTMSLQDAVQRNGGALAVNVEGQNVHFYLEARNEQLAAAEKLLAGVLAAPKFDRATFKTSIAKLRLHVAAARDNPLAAGTLMLRDAFYADSNAGQAPLGTLSDLDRLTPAAANAFFHKAYRRGGASATIVGAASDVNRSAAKALLATLAVGTSQPFRVTGRPQLLPQTSIISFRQVSAPWVLLGFPAPSAASDDFGAMLVLGAILEETFLRESTTSVPLSERPIGVEYDFHSSPGTLVLYVDGAAIDQSVALRELGVLRLALGSNGLNAQYVEHYKSMAEGAYISDVAELPQRAQEIASLANLGLGPDGVNTVLQKIDAVTVSDVQRVLKRYFDTSTAAFVLPRTEEGR